MSHHGREYEPLYTDSDYECVAKKLTSAVGLIFDIAKWGAQPKLNSGPAPHVLCDRWLEANGYDCEASRKRRREQRAAELDAEIERLRAERAKL